MDSKTQAPTFPQVQKYVFAEDKKHSVIYKPSPEIPPNQAICSSIYISRSVLPNGIGPRYVNLSLEIPAN